jgi:hypothetical protein
MCLVLVVMVRLLLLLNLPHLLAEAWWKRRRRLMGLLQRLWTLGSLRIVTRIYSRPRVREFLRATLERSMLRLLPCWHVWWGRNVYARGWIGIRWHVRLYTLAAQRRWYVRRLLLCWTDNC